MKPVYPFPPGPVDKEEMITWLAEQICPFANERLHLADNEPDHKRLAIEVIRGHIADGEENGELGPVGDRIEDIEPFFEWARPRQWVIKETTINGRAAKVGASLLVLPPIVYPFDDGPISKSEAIELIARAVYRFANPQRRLAREKTTHRAFALDRIKKRVARGMDKGDIPRTLKFINDPQQFFTWAIGQKSTKGRSPIKCQVKDWSALRDVVGLPYHPACHRSTLAMPLPYAPTAPDELPDAPDELRTSYRFLYQLRELERTKNAEKIQELGSENAELRRRIGIVNRKRGRRS